MGAYELRIRGLADERTVAAVRWELFIFHDIKDVVRGLRPETVVVLFDGDPEPRAWCDALAAAGYRVEPPGTGETSGAAA